MIRQLGHRTLLRDTAVAAPTNVDVKAPVEAIGARFTISVSVAGTSLDVQIQRLNPTSGGWEDIDTASFPSITATGEADLVIYPGVGFLADERVSDVISQWLRVVLTPTGSFTLSLGVDWLG